MAKKKRKQDKIEKTSKYLLKLAEKLFGCEEEREKFIQAFKSPSPCLQALFWLQPRPEDFSIPIQDKPVWIPENVDLANRSDAPGKHPLHEAGYYYILDPSSVFATLPLRQIKERIVNCLDLCAAPGGKAISAAQILKPDLLIANEVIRKRTAPLISNMKRCQVPNSGICSRDPSFFSEHCPEAFDLVIVDAPCSGQSLLLKGGEQPGCFHPTTENMNFNRQKRIIANAGKATAPGGFLIYSTCTFSLKENEKLVGWFLKNLPEFRSVEVKDLHDFQSSITEQHCYRLFPQNSPGAGTFTALFKRAGELQSAEPFIFPEGHLFWSAGELKL